MATPGCYMTITGKAQGLSSTDCSTPDSTGNKYQSVHTDEIMVLAYQHNMVDLRNINKPSHRPIIITEIVDKSSPLLAQALSSREEINCTICFNRMSSFGLQEKFYSVSINGGIIADLTFEMPHVVLLSDAESEEQLAIRYCEIICTHHLAGATGQSSRGEEG